MTSRLESDVLVQLDRAARPLRRVLARGAAVRVVDDVYFASSCTRLGNALSLVSLPSPFDEGLADVLAELAGLAELPGEERAARLLRAGHKLQRLDNVLGLPLEDAEVAPKRRVRKVRLPDERPAPVQGEAVVAPAAGSATASRSARSAPKARTAQRSGRRRTEGGGRPALEGKAVDLDALLIEEPGEGEPAAEAPRPPALTASARWDASLDDLNLEESLVDAVTSAGIDTVWDALTLRPARVESLPVVHTLDVEEGADPLPERVAYGGRVRSRVSRLHPGGAQSSEVMLQGATRVGVWWRRAFTPADLLLLPLGSKVVVVGSPQADGRSRCLVEGELARAEHHRATVVRYGFDSAESAIDDIVRVLVRDVAALEDPLPPKVRERYGLSELCEVIQRVHGAGADEAGRHRLAFDEALFYQLGTSFARFQGGKERGVVHALVHGPLSDLQLRDHLPPLSDAAQGALESIKRDLRGPAPMQRVIAGAGRSGVDDVALQTLLMTAEGKTQVMVVAPELPAAAVLFDRWETTLRAAGLVPSLVAGEPRPGELEALRRGEVHVAFTVAGPAAASLEFRRLGLVVAYEARTYGETRAWWRTLKSPRPDLLVVARTDVPAPVVLSAWSGFDVALIPSDDTAASGTTWAETDREQAYRALSAAVRSGRPGVLMFPLRRTGVDLLSLREVEALIGTLAPQFFEGARIVAYHGSQTPRDRQAAWADLVEKRAQLMVATYPVELMPVFPRGTEVVVEYADRIDPQRLLALREAVTPLGHVHYLHAAEPDPAGVALVRDLADGLSDARVVVDHARGFLQVPTETELPDFRWLDVARDVAVVVQAREEAHRLLAEDAQLRQTHGPRVLRVAHAAWARFLPEGDAPLPALGAGAGPAAAAGGARKRKRRKRRR